MGKRTWNNPSGDARIDGARDLRWGERPPPTARGPMAGAR